MRSSGSTRSPRARPPIVRWVWVVGDDHPRACTGRRLLHLGLARAPAARAGGWAPPIVLDPYAPEPLSRADRAAAERGGVLAVDCSWNQLARAGKFPLARPDGGFGPRRRLPFLIATNPQHYGRFGELNTVEALAAALYLLGRAEESAGLLAGFAGGPAFLEVNRERLRRFATARNGSATRDLERALFGGGAAPSRSSAPTERSRSSPRPRSPRRRSSEARR